MTFPPKSTRVFKNIHTMIYRVQNKTTKEVSYAIKNQYEYRLITPSISLDKTWSIDKCIATPTGKSLEELKAWLQQDA